MPAEPAQRPSAVSVHVQPFPGRKSGDRHAYPMGLDTVSLKASVGKASQFPFFLILLLEFTHAPSSGFPVRFSLTIGLTIR